VKPKERKRKRRDRKEKRRISKNRKSKTYVEFEEKRDVKDEKIMRIRACMLTTVQFERSIE